MLKARIMTTADLAEIVREAIADMSGTFGVAAVTAEVSKKLLPHDSVVEAMLPVFVEAVLAANGPFPGPAYLSEQTAVLLRG